MDDQVRSFARSPASLQTYLDPLSSRRPGTRSCVRGALTPRQASVLERLLLGESVPEIAQQMSISVTTARMHVRHLHRLSDTRNLHSLVLWTLMHWSCCVRVAIRPPRATPR